MITSPGSHCGFRLPEPLHRGNNPGKYDLSNMYNGAARHSATFAFSFWALLGPVGLDISNSSASLNIALHAPSRLQVAALPWGCCFIASDICFSSDRQDADTPKACSPVQRLRGWRAPSNATLRGPSVAEAHGVARTREGRLSASTSPMVAWIRSGKGGGGGRIVSRSPQRVRQPRRVTLCRGVFVLCLIFGALRAQTPIAMTHTLRTHTCGASTHHIT